MSQGQRFELPPELRAELERLGLELRSGRPDARRGERVVEQLGTMPLHHILAAATDVQLAAGLYSRPVAIRPAWLFGRRGWLEETVPQTRLLDRYPSLCLLFLFHGNGWLREAALTRLRGALPTPFWVVAVAYRLNDWVPEIRCAAAACLNRTASATDPGTIAQALLFLFGRSASWRRWSDGGDKFNALVAAPGVADALVQRIATSAHGPMARVLRQVLRTPVIDTRLLDLACHSLQPAVRAVALQALLESRARWPAGFERKWIDKSIGISRRVLKLESRPITHSWPLSRLVSQGLRDRSAAVRKVAATALVRHPELLAEVEQLAAAAANDKSAGVRERLEYVLRRAEDELRQGSS